MPSSYQPVLANKRILLIDDNPGDIELVRAYLEHVAPSIQLVSETDFQAGLDSISQNTFDMCLLDYTLGTYNGLEFLQIVGNLQIECPIIVLTGREDYEVDVQVMEAGALNFLNKNDLNAKVLERTLRYALVHNQTMAELKRSQQRLLETAFYDNLTGLPNRALFLDRLRHAFELWQRTQRACAVIFIDLNGFKPINDNYGHHVGDIALKVIAGRLKDSLRGSDTVARIGGDEFTLLLENIDAEQNVIALASCLRALIERPICIDAHPKFSLTASIGVAFSKPETSACEELLRCADIAMYRAKQKKSTDVEIFDVSMHKALRERRSIEQDLKYALLNDELELFYQPIVTVSSGVIYAFEALLRWRKNHKLISPASFIATPTNIELS